LNDEINGEFLTHANLIMMNGDKRKKEEEEESDAQLRGYAAIKSRSLYFAAHRDGRDVSVSVFIIKSADR